MKTIDGKIAPNMGVVIGLIGSRNPCFEWSVALATQSYPINTNVCYCPIRTENKRTGSKGPTRDEARDIIVDGARELKAPYIIFVDDDVEVPFSGFRYLLETIAQADPDVMAVGGIYTSKRYPIEPIVYDKINGHGPFWRWKKNTIFPCELIGVGCTVIKTEVFNHIEKPWFKDIDTPTLCMTDDGYFFAKVHLAGFKVLADARVLPRHWDYETMTPYELPKDSYPMRDEVPNVDGQAHQEAVGCGDRRIEA